MPILVHGSLRFIDSTDILVHADAVSGGARLYPKDAALRREVDALEEQFDAQLGPHTRRWAYQQLLPHKKQLRALWSSEAPHLEVALMPVVAPLVRRLVCAAYKITPESAQRSLDRIGSMFSDMDKRLQDGRRFPTGDCFTAADLTFAALAAPALFPSNAAPSFRRSTRCPFRCEMKYCAFGIPSRAASRCGCSQKNEAPLVPRQSRTPLRPRKAPTANLS